jgi:hypothetical protein
MNRKLSRVCLLAVSLLALAGSGSLFLARKTPIHRFASPHATPAFPARTTGRNVPTRSAPKQGFNRPADLARQTPLAFPFSFEPNVGQADSRVAFVGRGRGLMVFLEEREIAVQIAGASHARRAGISSVPRVISMRLAGAAGFSWRGREKLRGETNYFIGKDPRGWRTHVPHFAEVGAANAAPGVGMVLYGNDAGVEYDLRVAPGADLSALRFKISGADTVRLGPNGDILLKAAGDELRMNKPTIYQEFGKGQEFDRGRGVTRGQVSGAASAARKPVDGGYVVEADGSLGFRVGPHDPHAALVIDPSLSVAYATFLGGNGTDVAASVALDGAGKVYAGGTTTSTGTFPGASHTLGPGGGSSEFFIAKIDPTVSGPSSLVYLTFLGGSEAQNGGLIAATSGGSVAITGTTTSADFPVTDSSLPTSALTSGAGNDVAVSEIDPTGSTLVFSTIFGGTGAESQNGNGGIALDFSGDVYIASDTNPTALDTQSADLPVTTGAYGTMWDGQESDGFLAIFTPPAQAGGAPTLKYCSYLGTNALAQVSVGGIAVDSTGSAYIAGGAQNATTAFPFTNAFQAAYGGGTSDAFLMKIAPLGQSSVDLVYATLLGGSGMDQALAVALDSSPNPSAYVTGTTDSPDFPTNGLLAPFSASLHPTTPENPQANAFLTVVAQNATGQTSLLYSSYIGGSSVDAGQSVAVVAPNEVYVGGTAESLDFPWLNNVQPFNGQSVAFVAKFDPTSAGIASLTYATPLGGTSSTSENGGAAGDAVEADSMGHVYLAGATTSPDFPTAVTSSGNPLNGSQAACSSCWSSPPASDAFLAELQENSASEPAVWFSLYRLNFLSSATQDMGLKNTGEAPLIITNMAVVIVGTSGSPADFPLTDTEACTSNPVEAGSACLFAIGFSPSTTGYEMAVLRVTDNAPGSPQEFELIGAGPGLAALPVSVNFPEQAVGTVSDPQLVTFTAVNPSSQTGTIDTLPSLGGANPGEFQVVPGSTACAVGSPLEATSTCNAEVVFTPQAPGSFQSEIDITYYFRGSAEQELAVPLTGTASGTTSSPSPPSSPSPSASVSVVPSSINFNGQLAQTAGAPQSITITNSATGSGAGPLVFSGVSVKGASSSDFDITTNSCSSGATAPGGTCTVQIAFRPLQAATCGTESTRSATLMLSDNAPGSPQSVALTGTAEDFCFSAPSGQAASAPISPGDTATYNLQVNSSAGFNGSVALSCAGAPAEAACALSTSTVSVSPGTPGQFMVNVTTTAPTTAFVPHSRLPNGGPPNSVKRIAIWTGIAALLAAWLAMAVCAERSRRAGRFAGANDAAFLLRRKTGRQGAVQALQAGALLLALAAGLAACGGGGGASDPPAADPGTLPGTYTITVTATVTASSTTVTRTIQLPLTVN